MPLFCISKGEEYNGLITSQYIFMNRSKVGWIDNLEEITVSGTNYRQVLFTGKMQLVLMSLKPGEDIGAEIHEEHDQFIRIESGSAKAILNGEETEMADDDALMIPAGVEHNVINTGEGELKLYTIYAPPEHPEGTVQADK